MKRRELLIQAAAFSLLSGVGSAHTAKKTIRVGIDPNFPPFAFYTRDGEKLLGFDLDIIRAISRAEALSVEFVSIPFNRLFESLQRNRIDVAISAITINDERERIVDFSHCYYISGLGVAINYDDDRFQDIDHLDGKRLGVFIGSTGEQYVRRFSKARVSLYSSCEEAFSELRNGAIDAIINDVPQNDYFIKYSGRNIFERLNTPLTKEYLGIATKKGNWELLTSLNRGLNRIQKSGQFTTLYKKWFFKVPPRELIYPDEASLPK